MKSNGKRRRTSIDFAVTKCWSKGIIGRYVEKVRDLEQKSSKEDVNIYPKQGRRQNDISLRFGSAGNGRTGKGV